jgi:hypothetical protein
MELVEFLQWVVSPVGAGVLSYYLVGKIKDSELTPGQERVLASAIAAALSMAGYGLILVLAPGEAALPVGWRDWVATLFRIGTEAFGLATLIHAKDLPKVAQFRLGDRPSALRRQ